MEKYELKNRSSFVASATVRPPFWPIGWVKRETGVATAAAPTSPKFVLEEKGFTVSSILLGHPSLAVINGRSYSEGEFLRMPKGTAGPVRIRVQRITDGSVQLAAEGQMISVALRREVLDSKKEPEELLLLDEQ